MVQKRVLGRRLCSSTFLTAVVRINYWKDLRTLNKEGEETDEASS